MSATPMHTPTWIVATLPWSTDPAEPLIVVPRERTAHLDYTAVVNPTIDASKSRELVAFVLAACNSHDRLTRELAQVREALRDLVDTEEQYGNPDNAAVNESWMRARAVLAALPARDATPDPRNAEIARLREALKKVRFELGGLIHPEACTRGYATAGDIDASQVLNKADRTCVAKAYSAARYALAALALPARDGEAL